MASATKYLKLAPQLRAFLANCPPVNCDVTWGLSEDMLHYLYQNVQDGWQTLETGASLSTFAMKRSHHICVTPSQEEAKRIEDYCRETNVPFDRLSFAIGFSCYVSPSLRDLKQLDL